MEAVVAEEEEADMEVEAEAATLSEDMAEEEV